MYIPNISFVKNAMHLVIYLIRLILEFSNNKYITIVCHEYKYLEYTIIANKQQQQRGGKRQSDIAIYT